jgi:glycosyltransferase involved in cell wall biosynthesis
VSPRLAYLVSHPIQYQVPLFRRLARSEKISFVALFGCDFGARPSFDPQFGRVVDFGIDLLSGYEHHYVPELPANPRVDAFFGLATAAPRRVLRKVGATALVVHGWRTALMWQGAAAAKLLGIPYLMRAETPQFVASSRHGFVPRRMVRDLAVSTLVRSASGLLALGRANERFYLDHGGDPARVHRVPYFVEDGAVVAASDRGRKNRDVLRDGLGIPRDACVVVCVGKLMKRKRQMDLVDALAKLSPNLHLLLVGSGESESDLRARAHQLQVAERVHFAGFRKPEETWELLGASDLFALVSESEPWGLVINEAVVAGLPAIVSDECGAAEDLVDPGRTGEVVPVGDVDRLTAAIAAWAARSGAGERGDAARRRELAARHSLETAARAVEDAAVAIHDARSARGACA